MDPWPGTQGSENHPNKTTKTKKFLNEYSLMVLWNNIKHIDVCIIGLPEGKEREKDRNLFEEIVTDNLI